MPDVPCLHSETLFANDRLQLDRERFATPDGEVERVSIHHPGAVAIIVRPAPDRLLLVRQFRYPLRQWTLEIPAGTRQRGEDAAVTARRELEEETGIACDAVVEVFRSVPAPGLSDELLIFFAAGGLHDGTHAPDQGELVSVVEMDQAGIAAAVAAGEILDGKTLLALAWLGWWPSA